MSAATNRRLHVTQRVEWYHHPNGKLPPAFDYEGTKIGRIMRFEDDGATAVIALEDRYDHGPVGVYMQFPTYVGTAPTAVLVPIVDRFINPLGEV